MRRLIAVPTCWSYVYPSWDQAGHSSRSDSLRANAIRETWLKDVNGRIDVRFFFGHGAERAPQADEVFLDCGDDYYSLPAKVQGMFDWALRRGYSDVLKLDDDVYVYVDRLLAAFEPSVYRGYEVECASGKYASGTAYWLCREAMQMVVDTPWNPADWAEDKRAGRILAQHGVTLVNDERYHCCRCEHCLQQFPEARRVTSHTKKPHEMYELHKENSSCPKFQ